MPISLFHEAGWVGLGLLSLVFAANAVGLIDPRIAARELAEACVPMPLARYAVAAGRLLQASAVPALFFARTRPYAAIALALFLIPATLAAHAFWKARKDNKDLQLAGVIENSAIVGGLIIAAAWRSPS